LTLDYTSWRKILDWLPSFPTIFGLAWLATWFVEGRRSTNLFVAGVSSLALGLVGFGARFDVLQRILPSAQIIWAVMFLAVGGYLIWRVARRR
jgi:predicted permease